MSEPPEPPPCDCHYACDCREGLFSKAMETQRRVVGMLSSTDNQLIYHYGELSEREIELIRKVLSQICGNKVIDTDEASGSIAT